MPDVRRPSLSVPGFDVSFKNATTYHTNVENVVQVKRAFTPERLFELGDRVTTDQMSL
jgi:hypothetical protein